MRLVRILSASTILAAAIGTAQAGGFSRGTADTDILYEDGNFNMRAGAIIVAPTQKFSKSTNPALVGTDYLDTYVIPSGAVKLKFNDNLSCAGTYTDVYGAASSYASPFGPAFKVSETFTVTEFGATCAAFVNMAKGRLAVLGGAFIERFDYNFVGAGGALDIDLNSNAVGWRAGVAYEIPDIAFRTELMYRSGTTHDASGGGTFQHPLAGIVPVTAMGNGELPQSVELKVQSGIAPGWLAFGSVRWTDWSVNETLDLTVVGVTASKNQYFWRDGWTVTGGIGHAFTDNVSGLVSLQWDRGVSTGYDFRTDKWLLAAGLSMKDALGGELRFGGALSYLTSADATKGNEAGNSVDSGWAGIISANYKVKF